MGLKCLQKLSAYDNSRQRVDMAVYLHNHNQVLWTEKCIQLSFNSKSIQQVFGNFHKQEGHSGPESLTCTMCTSHISLCDPREVHFCLRGII